MTDAQKQPEYSISKLEEETGVKARTIHYFVANGLLTGPGQAGRYAKYTEEHLLRLKYIVQQRAKYRSLEQIKEELSSLSLEDLRQLATANTAAPARAPRSSASEYAARVRARHEAPERGLRQGREATNVDAIAEEANVYAASHEGEEAWRHIRFAPGVELQVRAALPTNLHDLAEELIAIGKRLFSDQG